MKTLLLTAFALLLAACSQAPDPATLEASARADRAALYLAAGADAPGASARRANPGSAGNEGFDGAAALFQRAADARPAALTSGAASAVDPERARQMQAAILAQDFPRAQALASSEALQAMLDDALRHHAAARAADRVTAQADLEVPGRREP